MLCRDNLRGFFEQCFPPLLKRVFGYDGSSWLAQVARGDREADANALLHLLSPSGPLFAAMSVADADGSIRFMFPRERLPAHTQMMLASPAGRKELELWPQYQRSTLVNEGQGKVSVHLGVTQYLFYWFMFYAIKGGDGNGVEPSLRSTAVALGSSVRKAADVLHLTGHRIKDIDALRHPYIALLRQFLNYFIPRSTGATVSAPAGNSALAASIRLASRGLHRTPEVSFGRGQLFYSIMLEFWLSDADQPVPVIVNRTRSGYGTSPASSIVSSTYQPPSEDLLEALGEVVKYAAVIQDQSGKPNPAQGAVSWLLQAPYKVIAPAVQSAHGASGISAPSKLCAAGQPPAQAFFRQVFRGFYRAFTMWPEQRSMKALLRAYLIYIAPWRSSSSLGTAQTSGVGPLSVHMTELVHRVRHESSGESTSYGPEWEAYVLSNLPFYLVLLPFFLGLSVGRVDVRGESAAQDILTVFSVFESAPELVELLQSVERDLVRHMEIAPRRAEGQFAEILPWLADQLHDWTAAASINSAGDTPFARAPPTPALFSVSDNGAAHIAKELLELAGGVLKPDPFAKLKKCLFQVLPIAQLPQHPTNVGSDMLERAVYDETIPRLPKSTWKDVQYKGDIMMRPISSYELGPLVRVLVSISQGANARLGLDRPWTSDDEQLPENRFQEIIVSCRRKGWRVDLRPLADMRILGWLVIVYFAFIWCWRVLVGFYTLLSNVEHGNARRPLPHRHSQIWQE